MTDNPFAAFDSQAPLSVAEDVPTADDNPFAQFSAGEPPPAPERVRQTLPITPVQSMPGVSIIGEDAGINDGITAIAERNTREGVAKMAQTARDYFAQGIEREVASYRAGRPELQDASGNQFTRGLARGLTTGGEMLGGAVRQIAESAGSDKLARIGEAVQGTAALERARFPEMKVDKIADVKSIGDFGNWMSGKIGEGIGSSSTILAGGAVGGWFGAAVGGWGLGVGSLRNELETAGVPQERMAEYAYTAGSVIGALDAIVPAGLMNSLSGNVKQEIAKQVVRRMAVATAKGSMKEGVTEALQEAVAVAGVAAARGDQEALAMLQNAAQGVYDERARIAEAGAAGAAAGSAFGATAGAGSLRGQEVNRAAKGDRLAPQVVGAPDQAPTSGPRVTSHARKAASQATNAPSSQPEAGVGQIKRDAAPETRAATREQFSQFLALEDQLAAIPDDVVAPPELINQALDAEEAMVESFRATGLPGDNLARGTRPISSMDDVRRAFDEATPEEINEFWQGKAVGPAASGAVVGAGEATQTASAPSAAGAQAKAESAGATAPTLRLEKYHEREDGEIIYDAMIEDVSHAQIALKLHPEDKSIEILNIGNDRGANSLKPAFVRKIRDALAAEFPQYEAVFGQRITGARAQHGDFSTVAKAPLRPRDITTDFLRLIATPTPRDQWGKTLGVSEDELMPHVERAIASGLLRVDRNGVVRRNASAVAEMEPEVEAEGQKIERAVESGAGPLLAPGLIEGENVTLTSKAIDKIGELQAIAEAAVAKILPRDVRIEVVDNIKIAKLAHEDELLALRAFHGSPRDFDRFDNRKALTGIGHQTYGAGISLSNEKSIGEAFSKIQGDGGVLYEVSVDTDDSRLLDFDLPLAKQSPHVRAAIEKIDPAMAKRLSGDMVYDELMHGATARSNTEASAALRAAGIDGIKYTVAGAKGTQYTIFDDGLIKIVKKNGKAVSAGTPLLSLRSSKSAKVSEGTEGESDELPGDSEGSGQASNDASRSGDAGAIAAAVGGGGASGASAAEGRILRQESATLRADGSIFAGRVAGAERPVHAGERDGRESQPFGRAEAFNAPAGYTGYVTADAPFSHARLGKINAPESQYRLATLTYRIYHDGTQLPNPKADPKTQIGSGLIHARISQHMDGTWEVSWVQRLADPDVFPKNMSDLLYASIEKDLGIRLSPSGLLSNAGLKMWQRRSPESVKWHQWSAFEKYHISPRRIKDRLAETSAQEKRLAVRAAENPSDMQLQIDWGNARKERGELIKLWSKLPLEARGATPNTMFSLRVSGSQAQTPALKRWFGASVVVDETGAPLVVYHGTRQDFEAFDMEAVRATGERDEAFFFSNSPSLASDYAQPSFDRAASGAQVMPVYLKMENPIQIEQPSWGSRGENAEIITEAKAKGHDGVIFTFTAEKAPDGGPLKEFVVFAPAQVKSAIGNRGSFDPSDPRISHAMREDGQALGQTNPDAKIISIGARAVEAEARATGKSEKKVTIETARHEALEFFLAKGFIQPKEWAALTDTARKENWVESSGVREPYTAKFGETMDAAQLEDLILKESIMVKYGEYERGNYKPKNIVAKVFKRIKDFLDRLRNSLKSQGFQRWEDIFQKMDAGEMRQRYEARFGAPAAESKSRVTSKAVPAGGRIAAMTLPGMAANAQLPLSPAPAGPTPGRAASAPGSLVDIQRNLRRKLGLTVASGRLDPDKSRAAGRAGGKLMGQFDRQTEVIRLRTLQDIDTEAHEVAHALENRYTGLANLQQAHAQELDGVANLTGQSGLSEGFAEFFRLYLTNPTAADAHAPRFRAAFENFIETEDAQVLQDIQEIQAQYQQWRDASSAGRITAAVKSGVPDGTWEKIRAEYDRGGLTRVGGMFWAYLEQVYKSRIDRTNPIRVLVERIARQAEAVNQDIDLSAWRNPQAQARKIPAADGIAYMDITRGVGWENAAGRGSISLRDALATAFGGTGYEHWTPQQRDDFGAYLIARRGRWLWQRHDMDPARNRGRMANPPQNPQSGDWYFDTMARQRRVYLRGRWESELTRAPDKHTRADHEQAVADLEAANPQFAVAAQMVYQFNRDLALKRFQAGLDSQEEFDYKNGATDYVPWFRDMTDAIFAGTGVSGRKVQGKFKIRGSYRDFINPVEGIIRQVYDTNREVAANKPKLLLAQLADSVQGAGKFAEIIPATRMASQEVKVRDALAQAAKAEGLPPEDAKDMIAAVAAMIGDDAVATLFRSEQAGDGRDAILHYMDGGELKMLQIHDDERGIARDILGFFEMLRGTPASDSFFNMITAAVRVPQRAITASVGFLWRNLIRDSMQASILQAGYFPIVSNIRTIASNRARATRGEESWGELLTRHGGIMGGFNRTDIQQARAGRVLDLRSDSVTLRPWEKQFWKQTINPWHEDFWKWAEWSEANARQTIARISFDRAIKDVKNRYPTMPAVQQDFVAMESAVHRSRDYLDYSRAGDAPSQMAINRFFMFFSPYLQGGDKSINALFLAKDNEGRFATAQLFRKKIAPLFNDNMQFKSLTKSEKDALKDAFRAWTTIAILAHVHLLMEVFFNDPEELEDKSKLERATSVSFTINGVDYRIPRGFDILNLVSNGVRATYDSWWREDPTARKRFLETQMLTQLPPLSNPILDLYIGWKHGRNNFFNSDIEQRHMAAMLPEDRYTAYTSGLARQLGEATGNSPAMVEYTMNTLGADWSRDILRAYDVFDPNRPALRWQEFPFLRAARGLRGSRGSEEFWDLMGADGSFTQPANSYKDGPNKGWTREDYRKFFDRRLKDDDAKAYAIMAKHYNAEQRRLHPMERAREMASGASAVMRDVASNRIKVPVTGKIDRKVEVSREVRAQAIEILGEINRREYRNALIALKRPGYENREPQPVKPYLEELKTISPEIHKALIGEITNSSGPKVYDYDKVREAWPDIRRRILATDKRERIIESQGDVEFSDLLGRAQGPRAAGIR
jgi:hypothetical protein